MKHCKLNHREKGEHLRFAPKRASSSEATPVDPIATKKGMRCPMCDHVSRDELYKNRSSRKTDSQ